MPIVINGSTGITFPAGGTGNPAGTVVGTTDTQALTNKSFDSASVATVSGTAPLYMARAWVNFNGTGVVAIRASGNVSSITDTGVGSYTVNFSSAMPDANYSIQIPGSVINGYARAGVSSQASLAAGSVAVNIGTDTGSSADRDCVTVAIFR